MTDLGRLIFDPSHRPLAATAAIRAEPSADGVAPTGDPHARGRRRQSRTAQNSAMSAETPTADHVYPTERGARDTRGTGVPPG